MNKQTAVEWLIDNLPQRFKNAMLMDSKEIVEQAKAMEKEQLITSWHNGYDNQSPMIDEENCGDNYYNETYGGEQ